MWACNLHIPLMIRFPGRIRPGTVVTEFTRQIDVMPTLLDYTGLPMPYNVEGISMRGLIEGRESNLRLIHHAQNFNVNAFACSVRNAEYTFLFGNNHELVHAYDRRTDPGETIDLFQGKGEMRHGVEHSIRDAQEK
jgi:arylsulfatase A-like enzyme